MYIKSTILYLVILGDIVFFTEIQKYSFTLQSMGKEDVRIKPSSVCICRNVGILLLDASLQMSENMELKVAH